MQRVLIWDLPTRLFHWLFATGFLGAVTIALLLGDEGPLFPYHAIIGLVLGLMVVLRLVWGIIGSRYARFGSFIFMPGQVAEYAKGVVTGSAERYTGHNPGSAYAIFAMLALMLAIAATGFMIGVGNEGVKELHEVLVYVMLAVVGAHLLGVIVHSVRHRENITASMIHGRKESDPAAAIRTSHPLLAVLFLSTSGAWAAGLLANYEKPTASTRLPLLGAVVRLGEVEGDESESGGFRSHDEHEHDDDD